jgi:hypothetical protein
VKNIRKGGKERGLRKEGKGYKGRGNELSENKRMKL